MAYIDDATNNVFCRFYDYEGTMPAMDSFKRYVRRYGLPQSVYMDKHTTYKSTRRLTVEEELRGQSEPMSQFERALDELGVEVIHANSPQAKGRVERLFAVLQDRLVTAPGSDQIGCHLQDKQPEPDRQGKIRDPQSDSPDGLRVPIALQSGVEKFVTVIGHDGYHGDTRDQDDRGERFS